MFTATTIKKAILAIALLSSVSACAVPQSSPNMVNYSYVPPTTSYTVEAPAALEAF